MWKWLTHPEKPYTWGFIIRVVIKSAVLFVVFNLLFAFLRPMDVISRLSLYNVLFDGRVRLPYAGLDTYRTYALTVNNIPAMLSTHQISRPKADDEFRVLILGNSGIWGFWLSAEDTITPQLNDMGYLLPDGKRLVAYNLAYPYPFSMRDLILLDEVINYHQPDMVVWIITISNFHNMPRQFDEMVANNPDRMRNLIDNYGLNIIDANDDRFVDTSFYGQTLIGQRRKLAELLRLQLYGVMWEATGIDHVLQPYDPPANDLENNVSWGIFEPFTEFDENNLFMNVLDVGYRLVGDIPLILVNQPMYIATGLNSDIRYNTDYPRWAVDSYRRLMTRLSTEKSWLYCDLWGALPNESYTDSSFHMTPSATGELGRMIGEMITDYADFGYLGQQCE
jgi:hypothetical protein